MNQEKNFTEKFDEIQTKLQSVNGRIIGDFSIFAPRSVRSLRSITTWFDRLVPSGSTSGGHLVILLACIDEIKEYRKILNVSI